MPASEYILKHLFQNDPIRWLNEGAFSAASMKKINSINSDENDENDKNDNEEVHLSLDLPNRMEMLRTSWQLD